MSQETFEKVVNALHSTEPELEEAEGRAEHAEELQWIWSRYGFSEW